MNYGCGDSGATPQYIPYALASYFNYDTSTLQLITRPSTAASVWINTIISELSATPPRPLLFGINGYADFTGSVQSGGHAVVIDGYQNINGLDQVHINYGWGGSDNNWYDITDGSYWVTEDGMSIWSTTNGTVI